VPERRSLQRLTTDDIIAALKVALRAEYQAVADYGSHAQATDRPEVRKAFETLSDVEREHAMRLKARISALGGTALDQMPEPHPMGDTLAAWLAQDLQAEQWAIIEYARLVAGIVDDDETTELMTELLLDEIRHAGWLKATLRTLEKTD
jgi:bacterioferritin (cytochrome b1)